MQKLQIENCQIPNPNRNFYLKSVAEFVAGSVAESVQQNLWLKFEAKVQPNCLEVNHLEMRFVDGHKMPHWNERPE